MSKQPTAETLSVCSLTWPDQRWNLILFAVCTGLQYLTAPVLYVGITQASLCDRLGADARTANLPGTLYFAMTAMPAVIAWVSPRVSSLKRNLTLLYGSMCGHAGDAGGDSRAARFDECEAGDGSDSRRCFRSCDAGGDRVAVGSHRSWDG